MQRSKRSLDATKWNRGSPHHTHDRVGDSLDGRSKRSLDATKWNRGSPHHTHNRVGGSLDGSSKRSLDATQWNRGSLHHAHDRVGGSLDGRSKRSLDATKWNRGSPHHTHDRVGDSLDGGRRWVMVEKPEPFCGRDWQQGMCRGWCRVSRRSRCNATPSSHSPSSTWLSGFAVLTNGALLAREISDRFPRFHFVASRLRLLSTFCWNPHPQWASDAI